MAATYSTTILGNDGSGSGQDTFGMAVPGGTAVGTLAIICAIQHVTTGTFSLSGGDGGWTTLSGPDDVSTNARTYVWAKELTAGDIGATITVTSTASGRFVGRMDLFTDADLTGTVIAVSSDSTADTTVAAPGVSIGSTAFLMFNYYCMRIAATAAAITSAPASHTLVGGLVNSVATNPNISIAASWFDPSSSGTQGGGNATADSSVADITYTIGIADAATTQNLAPASITTGEALGAPTISNPGLSPIRGVSSGNSGGSVTGINFNVTQPSGVTTGDFLALVISLRSPVGGTGGFTAPSGWILVETVTESSGFGYFYRAPYDSVGAGPWNFTGGTGDADSNKYAWVCLGLNGNVVGGFLAGDATAESDPTTDHVSPSVTPGQECYLIGLAGDRITGGSTWTWPAGWTEQGDTRSDTGTNAVSAAIAVKDATGAGTSTSVTATSSISAGNAWTAIYAYALNSEAEPTTLSPTAIGTGESVGAPAVSTTITLAPDAISTSEAVGEPTLVVVAGEVAPQSISTAEAVGEPSVSITLNAEPDSITTGEALGEPSFNNALTLETGDVATGEIVPEPTIVQQQALRIFRTPYEIHNHRIEGALVASLHYGISVFRIGGEWGSALAPSVAQETTADLFYRGGHNYVVSDEEAAALEAEGYTVDTEYRDE